MKRILLFYSGLFSTGVEFLLNRENDLEITSVDMPNNDENSIIEKIIDHKPNVVILDDGAQFYKNDFLVDLLNGCPNMQVLVLNFTNNCMQIYNKQEIQITESKDLITAIRQS